MSEVLEKKGIKEISELLKGIEVLAIAAKKIGADGKISIDDLGEVLKLANSLNVLVAAAQGAEQIKAEAKDLDAEESQALLAQVLAMVAGIKAA